MKTLLFHIDPDDAYCARLKAVLAFAEKYGSHIVASHILAPPASILPYSQQYMLTENTLHAIAEERDVLAQKAREPFEAHWPETGPTWEWQEETGSAVAILAEQARTADMVAMGLGENRRNPLPGIRPAHIARRQFDAVGTRCHTMSQSTP